MEVKLPSVLELLRSVQASVLEWEAAQIKIVTQLQSMRNLTSQLQALETCCMSRSSRSSCNSGLGVLDSFSPITICSRLRGEIMISIESAACCVLQDTYVILRSQCVCIYIIFSRTSLYRVCWVGKDPVNSITSFT